MKAVVAAFNQEKALVGAFSVLTNPSDGTFSSTNPVLAEHEHAQVGEGLQARDVVQPVVVEVKKHQPRYVLWRHALYNYSFCMLT